MLNRGALSVRLIIPNVEQSLSLLITGGLVQALNVVGSLIGSCALGSVNRTFFRGDVKCFLLERRTVVGVTLCEVNKLW